MYPYVDKRDGGCQPSGYTGDRKVRAITIIGYDAPMGKTESHPVTGNAKDEVGKHDLTGVTRWLKA